MKFFLIILNLLFIISCNKNEYDNKNFLKYIINDNSKKVEKILKSGFKIKNCFQLQKILLLSYQFKNYKTLKILKKYNIPISDDNLFKKFKKNNKECSLDYVLIDRITPDIYLEFKLKMNKKFFMKYINNNNIFKSGLIDDYKILIEKYKYKLSNEDIATIITYQNRTKYNLLFWEEIFNKINYNWFSNYSSIKSTIFHYFINNSTIDWSAIKHIVKKGGNWNLPNFINRTPFTTLLKWEDVTLDMLKFAIKTGAKWKIKEKYNPFTILLKRKDLNLEMLKFAIKTGAKWDLKFHYTPFSDLVLNPNIDLKMIKFALKTGAKIENISDLLISRAKKEEVRDYLMKLKKESLKK